MSKRPSESSARPQSSKAQLEDVFMASTVGDIEWLLHSIKSIPKKSQLEGFDKNGFTALHLAALNGRSEAMKVLIEQMGLSVNIPSSTGWRPLHVACCCRSQKLALFMVKYLLHKGADINMTNDDGTTALHMAASEGQLSCVQYLLTHGADAKIKDIRGHTSLDLARLWSHRMCARVLSSEKWTAAKELEAEIIKKDERLAYQKFLDDIEQEMTAAQRKACADAVRYTLATADLPKTKKRGKQQVSRRKTSLSNQPVNLETPSSNPKESSYYPKVPELKIPHHPSNWNTSINTKAIRNPYQPNLLDVYPRDPLTKLPFKNASPSWMRTEKYKPKPSDREMWFTIPEERKKGSGIGVETDNAFFHLTNAVEGSTMVQTRLASQKFEPRFRDK